MKRKEFIRYLEALGCVLLRHSGRHDIYMNPRNGLKQPVPRHAEIDETLVKHVKKYLSLNS